MIDAGKAVPQIIPLLLTRGDWPPSRVVEMLQTAGADVISDQLAAAAIKSAMEDTTSDANGAGNSEPNYAARMVRYLELAYNASALPAARAIAQSSHDPEVLAACLRLLKSSEDLTIVRPLLAHEDWRVRVQAASTVGRIGEIDDEKRLLPLLSDRQWWVRYRAAQALAHLPSMRESKLKIIQAAQTNPFARDILAQVMAEVQYQ
jgi:HEAT repeat protein